MAESKAALNIMAMNLEKIENMARTVVMVEVIEIMARRHLEKVF